MTTYREQCISCLQTQQLKIGDSFCAECYKKSEREHNDNKRHLTMTKAALIRCENGEVMAIIDTSLQNGTLVKAAYQTVKEMINTKRPSHLGNAFSCKISRNKKYLVKYCEGIAITLNKDACEFLIVA